MPAATWAVTRATSAYASEGPAAEPQATSFRAAFTPRYPELRRVQLICLLQFRDERAELPDWLASVTPHVDGIVALDDGSTDGGAELLAAHPKTRDILIEPPDRPGWDEPRNHRRLVEAGLRHDADWLLCLDADDRLELEVRLLAPSTLSSGPPEYRAAGLNYREVWSRRDEWRCDGIWGSRTAPTPSADGPLRVRRAPAPRAQGAAQRAHRRHPPDLDTDIYHLGMLTPELRTARRARYEALDPGERYQPGIGYAYLTDDGPGAAHDRARAGVLAGVSELACVCCASARSRRSSTRCAASRTRSTSSSS